jgi:hypothetical protein
VAEDPDLHLVPHLEADTASGLRVLACASHRDGVLEVLAEHQPGDSRGELRRRAWMLLASIAEPTALVRERDAAGAAAVFEMITGVPDGAGPFATHGHTVRLVLRPPTAPSR